jgi:N-[(2S)-2-amino-2-carboxyethyl]-L-glutamate dehydrogenase
MFSLHVVSGSVAREIISGSRQDILDQVSAAYLMHHAGRSINPNSYFLRFPEKPDARIIALPAYLGGKVNVAGIKWISSFPANIIRNIPRASAVLLLNDYETGYPFACLEASQISAARTAASAVLGAEKLVGGRKVGRLAVIGAGIIARNIIEFFAAQECTVQEFVIVDHEPRYAHALAQHTQQVHQRPATTADNPHKAIDEADVVVLATTAAQPYLTQPGTFAPGQVILNISLRDIGPDIIVDSYNVLDDIDHCMTANTAPHLAEQKFGHRDFINGTLAQVMRGEITLGTDRPKIFSPFGLGVLDLAVGMHVYQEALRTKQALPVGGFFAETRRW